MNLKFALTSTIIFITSLTPGWAAVQGHGTALDSMGFQDFESADFSSWSAEGSAFGDGPVRGAVGRQGTVEGFAGERFANSFHGDDAATGRLVSPTFTIEEPYIHFLIGGGDHPGRNGALLEIDGESVRSATGRNNNALHPARWDVSDLVGREARIVLIDSETGGWGFTIADHFVFSSSESIAFPAASPVDVPLRAVEGHPGVTFASDLDISVFADGDQIENVTAFSVDDQGRVFAAETHRHRVGGVTDNRENRYWVVDDIQSKTVEDRVEMHRRYDEQRPISFYTKASEKIRLVEDTDGDGKADRSVYFAEDGFGEIPHGVAAGILALDDTIYFACIPGVYALRDTTGDGRADERELIQGGFGLHVSLSGHDLNGFVPGPDGRLYFSVGDRGAHFTTADGREIALIDEGGVLRMERDGSNIEVVHRGLRNPKELAWTDVGDWFSVDNNADMGDRARVVAVQWGADSGWSMGWQILNNFWEDVGLPERPMVPWMDENIWAAGDVPERPDHVLPPVDHLTNGPSGLVFNPGATLLPSAYDDHFFVADYKGSAAASVVYAFQVLPDGAEFRMDRARELARGVAATDVDFAPDGHLYVSDYMGGWTVPEDGIIWAAEGEISEAREEAANSAEKILAAGVGDLVEETLLELLDHPSRTVRLRAQYELADRGEESVSGLAHLVRVSESQPQRLHALWALGMLARLNDVEEATAVLRVALDDADPAIRRNAATALAEAADGASLPKIAEMMLSDPEMAVRRDAALAVGRIGDASSLAASVAFLERHAAESPYLRHAGTQALHASASAADLAKLAHSENLEVRRAVLVLQHREPTALVAEFLSDPNPGLVRQAILTINNLDLQAHYAAGAAVLSRLEALGGNLSLSDRPTQLRLINLNYKDGSADSVRRLWNYAAAPDIPVELRQVALRRLADWGQAQEIDPTTGWDHPRPARDVAPVADVMRDGAIRMLGSGDPALFATALQIGLAYDAELTPELLIQVVESEDQNETFRVEALRGLVAQQGEKAADQLIAWTKSADEGIANAALAHLAVVAPDEATAIIRQWISDNNRPLSQRQEAMRALGLMDDRASATMVREALNAVENDTLERGLRVELTEVIAERPETEQKRKLAEILAAREAGDSVTAAFSGALAGGEPLLGRQLFFHHGAAQCTRCHALGEHGSSTVAPDLAGLADRLSPEEILESVVDPGANIAPGYGHVTVTTAAGERVSGIYDGEKNGQIQIRSGGGIISVARADVTEMTFAPSAMPPMRHLLDRREIRDLVAFLTTLKADEPVPGPKIEDSPRESEVAHLLEAR